MLLITHKGSIEEHYKIKTDNYKLKLKQVCKNIQESKMIK